MFHAIMSMLIISSFFFAVGKCKIYNLSFLIIVLFHILCFSIFKKKKKKKENEFSFCSKS